MKSKLLGRACALVALTALFGTTSGVAFGSAVTMISFGGSGLNAEDQKPQATVAGEADFYVYNTGIVNGQQTWDIRLVLYNTTPAQKSGVVLQQADIMTGVAFTVTPSTTQLKYNGKANPTLHTGSVYYASQTDWKNHNGLTNPSVVNPLLANTWSATLTSSSDGTNGVGTSGFGSTFSMSGLSGGSPGSTNYGLANNNYPLGNADFGHFPYILNALNFDFTVTGPATLTASQISGVKFMFGTDGCGIITAQQIPEPGTMTLAGIGLTGLAFWRRRSRKQGASAS